jgi:uncharacterized membrane protein (DUF373 family)
VSDCGLATVDRLRRGPTSRREASIVVRGSDRVTTDVHEGDEAGSRQLSRHELELLHRPLRVIDLIETLVHYLVAILLLVIAGRVLWHAVVDLVTQRHDFAEQVIRGINDILLVVIMMELLRTVVAHLETNDFQLRSFLVIGIISAVRHILAVGAQLTVTGHLSNTEFRRSQIELAVSAGVVLALAIGFLLINRAPGDARPA